MPFQKLIDPETGRFHDKEQLREFLESQLDSSRETITSCGTGLFFLRFILIARCYRQHPVFGSGGKWISFKEEPL
jgi:3-mercaptopyruvate sulfurtransferase SseA